MTPDTPASAIPHQKTRLPLFALVLANAISTNGNMLTAIAVPWFVLETTGSAARTGLSGALAALPIVLSGIFGGALVDRLGFKRASIVADLTSCLTVALIPLLHHTVGLAFWQLLALVFLGALLDASGSTARQSLVPDVAAYAGQSLERTNALMQIIPRASILIGPPVAGVLIVLIGTSNVLWVDAATFALSAALIAFGIPRAIQQPAKPASEVSYIGEVRAGLRFIREQRTILYLLATFGAANFLLDPLFAVVLPVLANEQFGDALELGIMVAAFGAGALLGTLGYAAVGAQLPRRKTVLVAISLAGLPLWIIAAADSLSVIIAALFVMGLGIGPISPLVTTAMHERVPVELRGRVFGAWIALATASIPLGIFVTGVLISLISLRATLTVIAVAYLAVIASAFLNPALREIDRLPAAEPAPAD